MELEFLHGLSQPGTSKIVLCSLDGLGGLPRPETGKSELETARIPHLHALAGRAACGLIRHVGPGITPGSGPGHLGLFGYDPLRFPVGRGVLEALGIDFELKPGDVAARGNFCTVDAQGKITDRRAGRISTEMCARLVERLRRITVEGAEVLVEPVKEHRFVLVLRGAGLSGRLSETDPQALGVPPLAVRALAPEAGPTAAMVNQFVDAARPLLRDAAPANMLLLRGFDQQPQLPRFPDTFRLRAAAIAAYPMYRGLARLVGMDVLKTGSTFADEIAHASRALGRLRLLLPPLQGHRQGGRGRRLRGQGGGARAVRCAAPPGAAPSGPTSWPSRATTRHRPCSRATAGSRCRSWSGAPTAAPIRSAGSPSGTARAAPWACLPAQDLMPLLMANALRFTKYGA